VNLEQIYADLEEDEGCVLSAYEDTEGVLTIGIGHTGRNIYPGMVISRDRADQLMESDVESAVGSLDYCLPWWRNKLNDTRQNVLVEMCFNLGTAGLMKFRKFLSALEAGDYKVASSEMMNSLWATQVPHRAQKLSQRILTGVYEDQTNV
jgi:lysozyme